ncbi:MobF family relaxase [Chachezhania sediminis]|uniref:MobF family relaxase n=1 Tax=Chachezhania sediminis TaxID=2599291 RepID=UPI00131E666F|nr:MobF family relaxase [Chachezhania sediminis]
MLSVSRVSAGAAASGYYKEEGYYQAGTPEAEGVAQWFGKAATALGLTGPVDDARFTAFLEGQAPDGRMMGKYEEGERKHFVGTDLTFSASKTASVAALVLGDTRIIEAHDRAVRLAMSVVEERFVTTRWYEKGVLQRGHPTGIIAGIYRHDTSRALDPNLHSHAVVTNIVANPTGGYTAAGNREIFRNQKLITEIYRSEFQQRLEQHGIATHRGRYGEVQVSAVPEDLAEMFSKRRQEILDALDRKGLAATPANAARATLATRAAKHKDVDRDALRTGWSRDAQEAGFDLGQLKAELHGTPTLRIPEDQVRSRADRSGPDGFLGRVLAILGLDKTDLEGRTLTAGQGPEAAVAKAIDHMNERASIYSRADLTVAAMAFSKDGRFAPVDKEIHRRLETGGLMTNDPTGHLLTDKISVALEREVLRAWRKAERTEGVHLNAGRDRGGVGALARQLAGTASLTEGQKEAITTALTGEGRFVGVQGYAGTGKTFMLERLAHYAGLSGYEVRGFAPSHQAVRELGKVLTSTQTVQSLLMAERSHPQALDNRRTILVVDEASMIGTRDMRDLMAHAERTGAARVVMVGDTRQLDAVSAGQPFHLLQKAGMRVAVMDEIRRQEDPELRSAVYQTIRGEIRTAFETLTGSVVQSDAYLTAAADRYLSLPAVDREGTRVLTTTNVARATLNDAIRLGLRIEGKLGADIAQIDGLSNRNLSGAQRTDARFFEVGNVVQATATSKTHGLRKGDLYAVTAIDAGRNVLVVRGQGATDDVTLPLGAMIRGRELGRSLVVYESEARAMAVGDRIRFRVTDGVAGVSNGQSGEVLGLRDGALEIRLPDGETRALDLHGPAARGMEHDYAVTAHAAQGESVDRVIVAMNATERLATQKSFYVDISRARHSAVLFTDDVERLARTVERETGERQHALSLVAQDLEKTAPAEINRDAEADKSAATKDRADTIETRGDAEGPGKWPDRSEEDVLRDIREAEIRMEQILTREKEITR